MKKYATRALACAVFTFGLFAGGANAQVYITPSNLGIFGGTNINGTYDVSAITGIPGLTLTLTNVNTGPYGRADHWGVGSTASVFEFNQTVDVELCHGALLAAGGRHYWDAGLDGWISPPLTPLDDGFLDLGYSTIATISNTTQVDLQNSAGPFIWEATGTRFEASSTRGNFNDNWICLGVVAPEPSTALLMTLAGGFFRLSPPPLERSWCLNRF